MSTLDGDVWAVQEVVMAESVDPIRETVAIMGGDLLTSNTCTPHAEGGKTKLPCTPNAFRLHGVTKSV